MKQTVSVKQTVYVKHCEAKLWRSAAERLVTQIELLVITWARSPVRQSEASSLAFCGKLMKIALCIIGITNRHR